MYIQRPLHPAGYRQIQLSDLVERITPPLDAVQVIIQPTGQAIRLRDDSIDPTVNLGILVANGATFVFESDTRSLCIISANSVAGNDSTATIDSGAANSDLTFTAVTCGASWNGQTFETANDAVAGVNSTAVLNSNAVNSDLTFTSLTQDPVWDGENFTTIADATTGANATATLNSNAVNSDVTFTSTTKDANFNGYDFSINADATAGANAVAVHNSNAANSDMTFTSPTKSATYNGTDFTYADNANESVSYDANTDVFLFNLDIANGANAASAKTLFDAALGGNPGWPQWTSAVEGDGSGVVDAGTSTSANGVTPVAPFIEYANAAFVIHVLPAAIASAVVTLWANGPAECANWAIVDEGDGTGAVDELTDTSANGVTPVAPYIEYANGVFTVHILAANIASDVVALWALGPNECANWAITDAGNGSGVVDVLSTVSAGGTIPVAPSIDYANDTFTIHFIPATTTANDAVNLWANGPADCADWTVVADGDGTGILSVNTDTSANGTDTLGALVNFLWSKEL